MQSVGRFLLLCFSVALFNIGHAKSCTFCRQEIVQGQAVYTTEYFSVLLDYEPRVEGHLLVIPKRHIVKAHELSKEEWQDLFLIIPNIVGAFSELLHTDQYIILEKNGPNAFQDVPHVHFHLFPVTSQTWAEIFNVVPKRLGQKELEEGIALFRRYFSGE